MDWEELAPLTKEQFESVAQLQQLMCKLSPIVPDIDKTKLKILDPSELSSLPSNHKLRERYKQIQLRQKQILQNEHDDDEYKYSEKAPKFDYVAYFIDQMTQQRNTPLQLNSKQQQSWNYLIQNANYMRNVLDSIENLQNVMKKLNEIYRENETQCQHIHNKCMHLIQEQKELEQESIRLKTMVKYFADYNQIRARIHSPKRIDVLSTEFHHIVTRINECIYFLTTHKEYKESDEYLHNYELLRTKCIHFIKNYVQQRLSKAEQDSKMNDDMKKNGSGRTDVNILEFRAAASRLRPLIKLIEDEARTVEEYAVLLNELQKSILNERHHTLKQLVDATISQYSKTRDTPNLIRASSSYVMMICLREYKLFNEFFDLDLTLRKSLLTTIVTTRKRRRRRSKSVTMSSPNTASPFHSVSRSGSMSPRYSEQKDVDNIDDDMNVISGAKRISALIHDLCHLLYSYLRPFVIKTSSMQTLCDVIHILQGEVQEHIQLQRSIQITDGNENDDDATDDIDSNIPEFDRTIVRIIEDAQERLVFRTQIHLRDEVQNYTMKESDLEYYALLKKIHGANNEDNEDMPDNDDMEEKDDKASPMLSRYSDWSPVLEKTLSVLSKVYPVLNHSVFEFLAYESVSCCVTSLVELARTLAHKSSSVHGHLFLIKHLLILREQISPFDVDFSITETTLDFGHMTQYLTDLVSSTSTYSLVEVFQRAVPTVNKQQLNSKKSMESVLKKGCEAFIETQTNLLIGPLISLISKYKQQSAIAKLRRQHHENEKKIHPLQPLKDDDQDIQIINDEERATLLNELNATLTSCQQSLIVRINELMDMMQLYLQNELTQRILLKPIISNMQSAFIQLRKIVIETALQNEVQLDICDDICDKLQGIVTKTSR